MRNRSTSVCYVVSSSVIEGFIDLADIIFFLLDNLKEEEIKNDVYVIFILMY